MLELCERYDMLPAGETVLCAVSGGADSMCLLHLLYTLAPARGFTLRAAHFDHRLRGEESDRDAAFVRAWCRERGIPLTCGGGDVAAAAARAGRGVEETARALRYAFLERTARETGAARIATAHTANDNAETLLLHLVRGTGLRGLAGIPPRRGAVVRPLLCVTRAQVERYCAEHGVPFVQDSTNADEAYTRNFLRRRVVPLLEQVNPGAVEHMARAALRLRDDQDLIGRQAEQALRQARAGPGGLRIPVRALEGLPGPVALQAVGLLLERAGGGRDRSEAHLRAVLALCRSASPSAQARLPGLTVRREYAELVFAPAGPAPAPPPPTPVREGVTAFGETGWSVTCARTVCPQEAARPGGVFFLSCAKITGPMLLRPRQTGDVLRPPGRRSRSLKKWMIDAKIPRAQRDLLPVLCDGAGVLAAALLGPDASRLARPGEDAFAVEIEREA